MRQEEEKSPLETQALVQSDILKNTLIWRGNSTALYNLAREQVRNLLSVGLPIYPPELQSLEERRGILEDSTVTISTEPDPTGMSGPIAPAEAVAVAVVQMETIALKQVHEGTDSYAKISEALGLKPNEHLSMVIEGFADFVFLMGFAAGYRQNILDAEPGGAEYAVDEEDDFVRAIRADGLELKEKTVETIINEIRNQANLGDSSAVKAKGTELAAALYLEAFSLSSKEFQTTL